MASTSQLEPEARVNRPPRPPDRIVSDVTIAEEPPAAPITREVTVYPAPDRIVPLEETLPVEVVPAEVQPETVAPPPSEPLNPIQQFANDVVKGLQAGSNALVQNPLFKSVADIFLIGSIAVVAPEFLPISTTAILASTGIGLGISEGISVATTGKPIPLEKTTEVALESEAFTLLGVGALAGVGRAGEVGAKIAASPLGRSGINALLGGGVGFVASGGKPEEAVKGALIGGGISLGMEYIGQPLISKAMKAMRPKELAVSDIEFPQLSEDTMKTLTAKGGEFEVTSPAEQAAKVTEFDFQQALTGRTSLTSATRPSIPPTDIGDFENWEIRTYIERGKLVESASGMLSIQEQPVRTVDQLLKNIARTEQISQGITASLRESYAANTLLQKQSQNVAQQITLGIMAGLLPKAQPKAVTQELVTPAPTVTKPDVPTLSMGSEIFRSMLPRQRGRERIITDEYGYYPPVSTAKPSTPTRLSDTSKTIQDFMQNPFGKTTQIPRVVPTLDPSTALTPTISPLIDTRIITEGQTKIVPKTVTETITKQTPKVTSVFPPLMSPSLMMKGAGQPLDWGLGSFKGKGRSLAQGRKLLTYPVRTERSMAQILTQGLKIRGRVQAKRKTHVSKGKSHAKRRSKR